MGPTGSRWLTPKKLLTAGAAITGILLLAYVSTQGWTSLVLREIAALGRWGNVVLALLFVLTSFPVPLGTTPLLLGAGFLYDVGEGYITVIIGCMIGASLSFWTVRWLLGRRIQQMIDADSSLSNAVLAVDRYAVKLCFIMRFMPIPFGIQNAVFAFSSMSFWKYFVATLAGLTPETLLLLHMGSNAKELGSLFSGGPENSAQQAIVVTQMLLVVAITAFLAVKGRRAFRQVVEEHEDLKARSLAVSRLVNIDLGESEDVEPGWRRSATPNSQNRLGIFSPNAAIPKQSPE